MRTRLPHFLFASLSLALLAAACENPVPGDDKGTIVLGIASKLQSGVALDSLHVVLKAGGIQMPVNGFGWHERARAPSSDELVATNAPWYLHAIDAFGPARTMFESNFPVDRASCSYTVLWNQFKKLTRGFSASERSAMFSGTAARVYRLQEES